MMIESSHTLVRVCWREREWMVGLGRERARRGGGGGVGFALQGHKVSMGWYDMECVLVLFVLFWEC